MSNIERQGEDGDHARLRASIGSIPYSSICSPQEQDRARQAYPAERPRSAMRTIRILQKLWYGQATISTQYRLSFVSDAHHEELFEGTLSSLSKWEILRTICK